MVKMQLTIFAKISISDAWQGSECTSTSGHNCAFTSKTSEILLNNHSLLNTFRCATNYPLQSDVQKFEPGTVDAKMLVNLFHKQSPEHKTLKTSSERVLYVRFTSFVQRQYDNFSYKNLCGINSDTSHNLQTFLRIFKDFKES